MLNNSEFVSELADILEIEVNEVTPQFQLTEDNWDSLAIVSVIALLDEQYDMLIEGNKLSDCKTIEDLINLKK